MTNRTVAAYVAHLQAAIAEAEASAQSSQFVIGWWPPDANRQRVLLVEAARLLDVQLVDMPETHPPATP